MSMCIYVLLNRHGIPTSAEWADTIQERGFEVSLDRGFPTDTSFGYVPCPDSSSGFEYAVHPLDDSALKELGLSRDDVAGVNEANAVVEFRFKTESDFSVVRVASGVLAEMTQGLILDGETGDTTTPDRAVPWARGEFEHVGRARDQPPTWSHKVKPLTWLRLGILVTVAFAALWVVVQKYR